MANFIHQNSRGLEKADHRGRATPKGEVVRDEVRLTSWRLCGVREQLYHPVISLDINPTHPSSNEVLQKLPAQKNVDCEKISCKDGSQWEFGIPSWLVQIYRLLTHSL